MSEKETVRSLKIELSIHEAILNVLTIMVEKDISIGKMIGYQIAESEDLINRINKAEINDK